MKQHRSWRDRVRLWLERESHLDPVTMVPYGSVEPFWDSRHDAWTRARRQLGVVAPINTRIAPKINYTRDDDDVNEVRSVTHALNVTVMLFF